MSCAMTEPDKSTALIQWLVSELRTSASRIGEMEAMITAVVRHLRKEQEEAARDTIRRGSDLGGRAYDTTVWASGILEMLGARDSYEAVNMIEDEAKRRAKEMAKEAEHGDAE